ncbi:YncE family protein [Streptomyces sp. NPDC050759]|uniref:YncE family protein n=1 Tax=Streptomyces sp. NPDC050759 TaxID=3365635 RepID=UPI00379B899D
MSSDGRRLYVARGTSVSMIDPDTGKAVGAPVELGAETVALNRVSVVDTRTMKALAKPVDVGQPPMSVAISPGGDRVWLALFRDLASFRTATPHSVSHFAVVLSWISPGITPR